VSTSRVLVDAGRATGRLGIVDGVLGTGGMVALVFAITRSADVGFRYVSTFVTLGLAALLLFAFVRSQAASRNPLLPLSLFRDRSRSGAYASMLLLAIGPMGVFYVITLYLQQVQHFSPLRTNRHPASRMTLLIVSRRTSYCRARAAML